jgi:hypothetical protein
MGTDPVVGKRLAAAQLINARSETAATKPAFRDALKSRRFRIDSFDRLCGATIGNRILSGDYLHPGPLAN